MPANRYKVQKKTWRKWTVDGQRIFNEMYSLFKRQSHVNHPDAAKIPAEHWETTRWNAAWSAADMASKLSKAADFKRAEFV